MKTFASLNKNIEELTKTIPHLDQLPDDDPDRCPLCDGYGHIIDEKGARACSCVRREIILTEFEDARIPERFKEETLETFDPYKTSLKALQKDIREYVENYSLSHAKGLYIYGSTGCGKTHLAVGILKALIERGINGVFYNVVDLLDAIRATYDPQSGPNPKSILIQQLQRQVFVLDDFGVQKATTWVADRLYALINRRYQDCKTLIITSNIRMPDLMMRVDSTLASRIIDMCKEIEIQADDFRKQRNRYQVSRKPPARTKTSAK